MNVKEKNVIIKRNDIDIEYRYIFNLYKLNSTDGRYIFFKQVEHLSLSEGNRGRCRLNCARSFFLKLCNILVSVFCTSVALDDENERVGEREKYGLKCNSRMILNISAY